YVPAASRLHRLHPVTKLAGLAAFIVAAFVVDRPLALAPLAAAIAGLLVPAGGLPNVRRLRVMFVLVFVFSLVVWTLFYGGRFGASCRSSCRCGSVRSAAPTAWRWRSSCAASTRAARARRTCARGRAGPTRWPGRCWRRRRSRTSPSGGRAWGCSRDESAGHSRRGQGTLKGLLSHRVSGGIGDVSPARRVVNSR